MTDSVNISDEEFKKFMEERREAAIKEDDPIAIIENVYSLWWRWADFHLYIMEPNPEVIEPPKLIPPAPLTDSKGTEFVYPIQDHGYKLSTSKAEDMFSAGMSMCKLYYTIEKMISILVERFNALGIDKDTEVRVAFAGHQLAQRKGFEVIINLAYNVVVTNFDPGAWGDRYLQVVKGLAAKGYGYPPEAPRDIYQNPDPSSRSKDGLKKT